MPDVFTAADARHWALLTRAALAARRTEIDALNVFPVPDGDTGTNLYLTLDAAIDEVVASHEAGGVLGHATLAQECRSLKRAILLSARGNSGVIVSQLVGGLCDAVLDSGVEEAGPVLVADALARGARTARASVAHPQEGTILTVADAGAAAAVQAAEGGGNLADVVEAAVDAAQEALARTPEQLEVLRRAGVVDAGGAGCVVLLESLLSIVTDRWSVTDADLLGGGPGLLRRDEWHPEGGDGATVLPGHDPLDAEGQRIGDGPAYEVMYLLLDTDDARVETLRTTLDGLGDSLLVVGGPDLWNVHVHVDDPGAAVEAGIAAGRPERIRITRFETQVAGREPVATVGVVACSAGPGIGALLEEAGAVVVPSGPGGRASAGQLLDAVRRTRATAVVILPADKDTLMAAAVAAEAATADGVDTHVVPARTTVQALAALAVLDPARPVHTNVVAMTGAAVATRHGAVSVASKEALTWAGVCQPGDVLGIVDGDIAFLGKDLEAAAVEVLTRLLGGGGELVTLVAGADAADGLAEGVAAVLERERPEVEVVVIDGGQPVYPLLIGVE
ncbi:DAK2 domain-containing protein [Oryzobacter telluris]|uniref:DAK2 domain-containing protein n=1 Tax=Oryzobacter telluris TaxID=3149179 RepID=UPI00370D33C0